MIISLAFMYVTQDKLNYYKISHRLIRQKDNNLASSKEIKKKDFFMFWPIHMKAYIDLKIHGKKIVFNYSAVSNDIIYLE